MRALLILASLISLASCDSANSGGPLDIAVIGQPDDMFQDRTEEQLTPAAQHLQAATHEGLVGLDPSGEIVPAVAERWIVTSDGLSYIFRLRESNWADGEPITAEGVRDVLLRNIDSFSGTALGLDFEKVDQVRAMTGRVIEIQLKGPMPDFLRLLAQPEIGFVRDDVGVGPMTADREDGATIVQLSPLPPEARGLPARNNWQDLVRPLFLRATPAELAVEAFANGQADLVLAGKLSHLPLADTGPLSAGTVRLDAPLGLFGLQVMNEEGVLSEPSLREAVSMAIERDTLMQSFNFGGWQSSTWIYPLTLSELNGPQEERWAQLSLGQRRAIASQRIAAWRATQSDGREAQVSIAMPQGPGSDQLFDEIAQDLQSIGVEAVRAGPEDRADLVLRDELARYYSPRWYLNRFHCSLDDGLCSAEADELVAEAIESRDLLEKSTIYAEAQRALIARQAFIPLGQPVRWSLVRAGVPGFQENQWGLHALFPLSLATI